MVYAEACKLSNDLNKTGKHKEKWKYYPSVYNGKKYEFSGQWFVCRRLKNTSIIIAVFCDGKISIGE
jgi:hypothetical protein